MSEKRVCRLHRLTLMQCRCPCPDKLVEVDCNRHCPQYRQPSETERHEMELARLLLRGLFRRVWRCEVVSSGYHNGATCTPDDAHFGWACEYRWIAPALGEEQAKKLGITE